MLDITAHEVSLCPTDFQVIDEIVEGAPYRLLAIAERVVLEGAVLAYTNRGIPGAWTAAGSYFRPSAGISQRALPAPDCY